MTKTRTRSPFRRFAAAALLVALAGCATPGQEQTELSLRDLTAQIEAVNLDSAEQDLAESRYEAARQKFIRLSAADPDNPRIQLGLAEALLGSGHAEEALEMFRKLAGTSDVRGRALQGEGLALLALGETDAAGSVLMRSLELSLIHI